MTAAVITPTYVQVEPISTNVINGTPRRLMKLFIEGAKAAQNDWFLLSTYIGTTNAANVLSFRSSTRASGDAIAEDISSYDWDDYKLVLTSAGTGTSFTEVIYYTE